MLKWSKSGEFRMPVGLAADTTMRLNKTGYRAAARNVAMIKTRRTGMHSMLKRTYMLLAVTLAGCAGAAVTQQSQSAPMTSARPTQIIVYPFAVDPSEVTLNQGFFQRTYRSMSGGDEGAQQLQIAHDTAENVCLEIVTTLKQKGYNAICQKRGVSVSDNNTLIVDGEFTDISEGNRLRRMVIGLGAGASTLDTSVRMYQRTDAGSQQVLEFATHADSGKMPGAGIMGPAGAAAGGAAAAASLGANIAAAGVKTHTSSTGFLADKTAAQIVDTITQYVAQHGWAVAVQSQVVSQQRQIEQQRREIRELQQETE